MSIESCVAFLQESMTSDKIKQQMKVMTDTKEVIVLGKRYGYVFDKQDLVAASSSLSAGEGNRVPGASEAVKRTSYEKSVFYHYEYDMQQIPGFEQVTAELSNLKIKPPTVNMHLYEKSYREDDFQFTSMSPATPEFAKHYEEIMQPHWKGSSVEHDFSRRDFHLVNLDQHVEHPLYDQYFQAKARIISHLEAFFDDEIRFSGSLWYPPFSYRLWHTNETEIGWRMYIVDFDEPIDASHGTSFFRYMNPQSKEIITLTERPKCVRFFKVEQEKDKLFWHCIVNASTRNRWSFGFMVPENWLDKLPH